MITLEQLAIEYQKGFEQSGLELLKRFQPLILKYTNMIYHNWYNVNDKQTDIFFKMITPKKAKNYKTKAKHILYFVKKIVNAYEYEDILQDIKCLFLELVEQYNQDLMNFDGYVNLYFKYKIRIYIFDIVKNNPITIPMSDANGDLNNTNICDLINKEKYYDSDIDETINENWILGLTCSNIFKNLTNEERLILKYYHIDNKTGPEIASLLNKPQSTIYDKLHSIKNKIYRYKQQEKEKNVIIKALKQNKTQEEIAKIIGKHQSTISRKIKQIQKSIN